MEFLKFQTKQQELELSSHSEKIIHLEKKVESLQTVLFQLLGVLYNKSEKLPYLRSQLDHLYGIDREDIPGEVHTEYENTWQNYPRTRQGDSNELRVNLLEHRISMLEEDKYNTLPEPCSETADLTEIRVSNIEDRISALENDYRRYDLSSEIGLIKSDVHTIYSIFHKGVQENKEKIEKIQEKLKKISNLFK
jgi:hypothetical protein